MPIGELIRTRRLQLGLTQRQLGERCGMKGKAAEMAIQNWEHDRRKPSIYDLRPLAEALQLPVENLIP